MSESAGASTRRAFVKGAAAASLLSLSHLRMSAMANGESSGHDVPNKGSFRPLFDGVSLNGWSRQIREAERPGLGIWVVQEGMIIGEQDRPTIGSYLVTDETFSDFELEIEARPDWRTDTGVYVRTDAQGDIGFQACIDYRPHGSIGGYYGHRWLPRL